jgi:DNA-directed RNA polymerase subunit L
MASLPKISNVDEYNNTLKFTLSNINVSYANAIRRILLSDIPCIVFKTNPYHENNVNIKINKSRLNNELIKQRISSIPIHIDNIYDFPYQNYIVELDKTNDTNTIIYATTEDFKIKNIDSEKYLETSEVRQLFPPDTITGDFIDIVRLRPKLTDTSEPEQLKFEAKLTISSAKEDGTFNVVSTCAYGNTLDPVKIQDAWSAKEATLKDIVSKEELEFVKKDWMLLDAKRLFIEDSFDFTIETIGIYSNYKLLELGISLIIKKLYVTLESLKNENDLIYDATDTLDNCYIITLLNEDYTIGKIIEYYLFNKYFKEDKLVNYVGFLKKHPHDNDSFIKISFKNLVSKDELLIMIEDSVNNSILLLNSVKEYFTDK